MQHVHSVFLFGFLLYFVVDITFFILIIILSNFIDINQYYLLWIKFKQYLINNHIKFVWTYLILIVVYSE